MIEALLEEAADTPEGDTSSVALFVNIVKELGGKYVVEVPRA